MLAQLLSTSWGRISGLGPEWKETGQEEKETVNKQEARGKSKS